MAKVSVVVPVYNGEKTLRKCLDSLAAQTLRDIEVIIVDDGSRDGSGAIGDAYAQKDARFRVVHKENTGYGHSMNVGFDEAAGEYIGIIEADDYAEPEMFELLVKSAERHGCDVVKSNFFFYYAAIEEENRFFANYPRSLCGRVLSPRDLMRDELVALWNAKPSIWTSIYRAEFLRKNGIRFHETPGAAYQDASFAFKVLACAESVFCLYAAFVHYRQDNELSSVNQRDKVYCVCDEYAEMERFIAQKAGREALYPILNRLKIDTYYWNMNRIADEFVPEFAKKAAQEFIESAEKGQIDKKLFTADKWDRLLRLARNPQTCAEAIVEARKNRALAEKIERMQAAIDRLERKEGSGGRGLLGILRKKLRTAKMVFDHEGFSGIVRVIKEKWQ